MIFNLKIDTNLSIKVTNTVNDLKKIIMTLKLNTRPTKTLTILTYKKFDLNYEDNPEHCEEIL